MDLWNTRDELLLAYGVPFFLQGDALKADHLKKHKKSKNPILSHSAEIFDA